MKTSIRLLLTAVVLVVFSVSLNATPITGGFGINGGNVTVTNTAITWSTAPNFTVGGTLTGDFIGLSGTGTLRNLIMASQPVGIVFSPYTGFLTFTGPNAWDTLSFDLTYIYPGMYTSTECGLTPAAGQNCTPSVPGGSPFNLSNTAVGSTASFLVAGNVANGATQVGTFTGTFSATYTGIPYQSLLTTLANSGQVTSTFSGTFDVNPVPEPSTVGMLVLSGLLIGATRLRRRSS